MKNLSFLDGVFGLRNIYFFIKINKISLKYILNLIILNLFFISFFLFCKVFTLIFCLHSYIFLNEI